MTSNAITNWDDKSAAVSLAHELGMPAEEFTLHGDAIVQAFTRHRDVSVAEALEALALANAALRGANMNMRVVERKVTAALAKTGPTP